MKLAFEIDVPDYYEPQAVYLIKNNGCCDKNYFVLTKNQRGDGETNYSCQCGCGGWVTSGFTSAQGAIGSYRAMCKRYEKFTKKGE